MGEIIRVDFNKGEIIKGDDSSAKEEWGETGENSREVMFLKALIGVGKIKNFTSEFGYSGTHETLSLREYLIRGMSERERSVRL